MAEAAGADFVLCEGDEAAYALEVHDRRNDAGEDEVVVRLDLLAGRYWGDDPLAAVDLDEEEPGQMAQTRFLDRLADQRARRIDDHRGDVFAAPLAECFARVDSVRQPARREEDQVCEAEEGDGDADRRELEEAHRRHAGRSDHARDDEVVTRTDDRVGASEDRRVAERDEEPAR